MGPRRDPNCKNKSKIADRVSHKIPSSSGLKPSIILNLVYVSIITSGKVCMNPIETKNPIVIIPAIISPK